MRLPEPCGLVCPLWATIDFLAMGQSPSTTDAWIEENRKRTEEDYQAFKRRALEEQQRKSEEAIQARIDANKRQHRQPAGMGGELEIPSGRPMTRRPTRAPRAPNSSTPPPSGMSSVFQD